MRFMNKDEKKELIKQLFKENEQKDYDCKTCEYSSKDKKRIFTADSFSFSKCYSNVCW